MNQRKLRSYDKEFKLNTVNLYLASGKTYRQISEDLDVPYATLAGWVEEHKKAGGDGFVGKGNIKPIDIEIVQLRKELSFVKEERGILKKALGIFSSLRKLKYQFMQKHRQEFCIERMSQLFKVSRSGYYRFIKATPSKRSLENKRLSVKIQDIHEASRKTYGAPIALLTK
ncbi:MAG: transposase [Alphaproteobacteria bacterium]